jgi:hypothetical protein
VKPATAARRQTSRLAPVRRWVALTVIAPFPRGCGAFREAIGGSGTLGSADAHHDRHGPGSAPALAALAEGLAAPGHEIEAADTAIHRRRTPGAEVRELFPFSR